MNFETMLPVLPPYSIIIEVDWNGKILNSWHSNSKDVRFFSDAKIIVSISIISVCLTVNNHLAFFICILEWLHVFRIPLQ
jgi:hypothetical protein